MGFNIISDEIDNYGQYLSIEPDCSDDCLNILANEYRYLRSNIEVPFNEIDVEGIGVFDTTRVQEILRGRTIPEIIGTNFDVIRSDMGEVFGYIFLEDRFDTSIGYKAIRERESIQEPSRGIDIIGVEDNGTLSLILGEVKVSGEDRNPPQVVDASPDSLSKQLKKHIENHEQTSKKLWDTCRKIRDPEDQESLLRCALYWDNKMWNYLQIVCCGFLLRPKDCYNEDDFGLLKGYSDFDDYISIRFIIACIEYSIDDAVEIFHRLVANPEGDSSG